MITESSINNWVEKSIANTDIFLVGIDIVGSKIIIELDNDQGVKISDCVTVNREIEQRLDLMGENFSIEVSSSGIGKPFKVFRQYLKHIGKNVEITDKNGLKRTGMLLEASKQTLMLKTQSKQKKKRDLTQKELDNTIIEIPMELVKETKATISLHKTKQ